MPSVTGYVKDIKQVLSYSPSSLINLHKCLLWGNADKLTPQVYYLSNLLNVVSHEENLAKILHPVWEIMHSWVLVVEQCLYVRSMWEVSCFFVNGESCCTLETLRTKQQQKGFLYREFGFTAPISRCEKNARTQNNALKRCH